MSVIRAAVVGAVACLFFATTGCGGQAALGLMPGVLNDPHNRSLRRAILAEGAGNVCDQLRARGLPLRLRDEDPVVGRFFVNECASSELPSGAIQIRFGGLGYVWTDISQRLGFEASGTVSYDLDFLLDGSTMYVYLRAQETAPPTFRAHSVEAGQALSIAGMFGMNVEGMVNSFGAQVMQAQLAHGLTLIRDESGTTELAPGVVPPGQRPTEAFHGLDRGKLEIFNERTLVQPNQRDFLGPFDVPAGKKLDVYVHVAGAPGIEVVVVPRSAGDPWLLTYANQPKTTPPPVAPLFDEVAAGGSVYRRSVTVPPGSYYLVLDNTRAEGRPAPASAIVSSAAVLE